ncbi:hypothetical protein MNBD_PLANCTO03-717 [hydrothermal vent metagenome]|uniref:Uncharacterized protein n=1 Tax=hydrothermal vent metagenome TaxID=652676 RepID=A0A3B1DXI2_9ZZZZ
MIVNTRRAHPVVCLVTFAAFLLHVAVAAGGVVLCQDRAGERNSRIDIVLGAEHCTALVEEAHELGADGCWCSVCPCEDRRLDMDIASPLRDDDVHLGGSAGSPAALMPKLPMVWYFSQKASLADSCKLAIDRLGQLRTVRLLV